MIKPRLILAILLVALFCAPSSPARAWVVDIKEVGGGPQYSSDFSLKHQNLQSVGSLAYCSTLLWENGYLRLDGRLEGQLNKFWNYSSGLELAVVPVLRLYLQPGASNAPTLYAEVGSGPSYNTLHVDQLGEGFNFLSFAGLGLRVPLPHAMFLDLGYRMRHISNAGLDPVNDGISSHQALLEMGWQY